MALSRYTLWAAISATVVGLIAVSNQSLWIDEANSAIKAIAPTFSAFANAMGSDRGSDLQMPLYMLMLWAWEKVFGHSEFALRTMNVPFFALALVLAAQCWRTSNTQRVFFVIFGCSSAFLWAYLDEARPYILQFLGATACTIALANVSHKKTPPRNTDVALFAIGVLILCGSSLLGVISAFWLSFAFLLLWLIREQLLSILKRHDLRLTIILCLPALILLAAYYLWSLSLGARASSVGSANLMSMAFAAYELLGTVGLGPGRGALRASHMALLPFVFPILAYILVLGILLCFGIYFAYRSSINFNCKKSTVIFWSAPIAMVAATILIGLIGDFRIVGRHLTPVLPFVLILLSLYADALWHCRLHRVGRAITIIAILAMFSSAFAYRFSNRHAKDDYRSAAALALETINEGGTVWWAADPAGANYYGIFPALPTAAAAAGEKNVILVSNMTDEQLSGLPYPQMLVISKPDIYDSFGHLESARAATGLYLFKTLPGFTVWRRR